MLQGTVQQSYENDAESRIQTDNGYTTRKFLIHAVKSEKTTFVITEITQFKQEGNSPENTHETYSLLHMLGNLWCNITHGELS